MQSLRGTISLEKLNQKAMDHLFLFCFVVVVAGAINKRLVLHSDQDIHLAISSMQAEISALKSESAALKSDNQAMKTKISVLESNLLTASPTLGSVYVRWGRTSCPGKGTEMVYNGRMAGNKWNEYGGGSSQLCLPSDPTWGKHLDGINSGHGHIFGTEIEDADDSANVMFGKPISNEDIPCAVCRTTRPSNVMIAGRVNCYPGWTLEYQGYVVSSAGNWHNNVDFVCLDDGLEFSPHGAASDDDHVIAVVEAICGRAGSLPCPPYVNGRELACVVCSK